MVSRPLQGADLRPGSVADGSSRRWVLAALGSALLLGLLLRLQPLLHAVLWGSDSGEYLWLAEALLERGTVPAPYLGWGVTYPYFPGMEVVIDSLALLSGLGSAGPFPSGATGVATQQGLLPLLQVVVPALNTLTVLMAFLLAHWLLQDRVAALVAAFVDAAAMPLVFGGSHPMPAALAEPLGLAVVLLVAMAPRRPLSAMGGLLCGSALVLTHHLTAALTLLPLGIILLVDELRAVRTDGMVLLPRLAILAPLAVFLGAYWGELGGPFGQQILVRGTGLPPSVLVGLSAGAVALLPLLVLLRRRLLVFRRRYTYPSAAKGLTNWLLYVVGAAGVFAVALLGPIPGIAVSVPSRELVGLLPLLLVLSFCAAGFTLAPFRRGGLFLFVWVLSQGLVLVLAIASRSTVLLSYRVMPFVWLPASLFIGLGARALWEHLGARRGIGPRARVLPIAGLVSLLLVLPLGAQPNASAVGGFQEGTTAAELNGVVWAAATLPDDAAVVSDHRLSSSLFGAGGLHASWEEGGELLLSDDPYRPDPRQPQPSPSGSHRVDAVVLSSAFDDGVALEQWQTPPRLEGAAREKFRHAPYLPIYADGTIEVVAVTGSERG